MVTEGHHQVETEAPVSAPFIAAYTDRLSYAPGDRISLYVSGPPEEVNVRLVRLVRLSAAFGGSELALDDDAALVPWGAEGGYQIGSQSTCIGSFLLGELLSPTDGTTVSVGAHIWMPKPLTDADQTIASMSDGTSGLRLVVRNGRVVGEVLALSEVVASAEVPHDLHAHRWYFVVLTRTADGTITSFARLADGGEVLSATSSAPTGPQATSVLFGAATSEVVEAHGDVVRGRGTALYNGKIEAPFVAAGAMRPEDVERAAGARSTADLPELAILGAWDLAPHADQARNTARSLTDGPDATLVNLPASGVTGRRWSGSSLSFVTDPAEWAAIHFHDDDLVDAGWQSTLDAHLPSDIESAMYGIRVAGAGSVDVVPIVVVPAADADRKPVTVLLSTFTYLAYANERLYDGLDHSAVSDKPLVITDFDRFRMDTPDFGLSQYDHHSDSSGVMFSTASRPVLNMRHDNQMWLSGSPRHLSADLLLIAWLVQKGIAFDIITDLELHQRGAAALARSRIVITGSHPEYFTGQMLTGLEKYRDAGGHLMYLGANGFYWVTGVVSESPLVIEIRRGYAGIRSWESYPGEVTLTSTREPGGLWRHRGRTPNSLAGVGMAAQGWGSAEPYWRTETGQSEAFAWVFDGVSEEPIGDYGLVMGGAAGDELDRADFSLGTPTNAVVLASSRGHTRYYQRVIEEVAMNFPGYGGGDQDPEVHADMVYFESPGGGRVFSVGSIAWSGSLLENDGDNGVSRITENVIREFLKE